MLAGRVGEVHADGGEWEEHAEARWQVLCKPPCEQGENGPVFRSRGAAEDFAVASLHESQRIAKNTRGTFGGDVGAVLVLFEIPEPQDLENRIVSNLFFRQQK